MDKVSAIIYASRKIKANSLKRGAVYRNRMGWFTTTKARAEIDAALGPIYEYEVIWPGREPERLEIIDL